MMKRRTGAAAGLVAVALVAIPLTLRVSATQDVAGSGRKSVLIVYHGGQTPWRRMPALDVENVDALTQPTTGRINVRAVAERIRDRLEAAGCRVDMRKATDVQGPKEFLEYDGIIFGTPTWFSNVAWPIKRIFDEHLIRIYEHRKGRLREKALAGFVTVMERGESGPNCLQCLTWMMEHLRGKLVEGIVVNVGDVDDAVDAEAEQLSRRFLSALKEQAGRPAR